MATEAEVAEAERRAEAAKAIIDHPMVVEAFDALDKRCWEAFKSRPLGALGELERVHALLKAQADFKGFFEILIRDGKNARIELTKQQNRKHPL